MWVTLKATAGGSKIKIWESPTKAGSPISLPKTYQPSELLEEKHLYVEGISASSSLRDVTLVLEYTVGGKVIVDEVKVTIVKLDIDAGLSEQGELAPGKYINVNWDDDDGDGWQPNDAPPGGTYTVDRVDPNIVGGDNDFRCFSVSISPAGIVSEFPNSKVSITFPDRVKVWQSNTKKTVLGESSELLSGAEFAVEDWPKQLYVEGVMGSWSFRDVELKATWLGKGFTDIVKVTVFKVNLTGLFGFGPMQSDNDALPFSQNRKWFG